MPSIDIELPPEKVENNNENTAPATLPVIGIIYPPPEVRSILSEILMKKIVIVAAFILNKYIRIISV